MQTYHLGALDGMTPQVHPEAWIAPGAVLVGAVTIGPRASVWYGSVLRADDDQIVVGAGCNIQDLCCLHVDEGEPAILAEQVTLGHRAIVHGAHIGAGALIGIGAVVLGRARIGAGSLIAAGTDPARQAHPAGRAGRWGAREGGAGTHRSGPGRVRRLGRPLCAARGPSPRRVLDRARHLTASAIRACGRPFTGCRDMMRPAYQNCYRGSG